MFILDLNETISVCGISMVRMIPYLITLVINLIKIGVPILLIIFGMLDLGKAVMAQKEDEIKKGQQTFIKRLTAAVVVFLVVFIVQIAINLVSGGGDNKTWACVDCVINYSSGNNSCGSALVD